MMVLPKHHVGIRLLQHVQPLGGAEGGDQGVVLRQHHAQGLLGLWVVVDEQDPDHGQTQNMVLHTLPECKFLSKTCLELRISTYVIETEVHFFVDNENSP